MATEQRTAATSKTASSGNKTAKASESRDSGHGEPAEPTGPAATVSGASMPVKKTGAPRRATPSPAKDTASPAADTRAPSQHAGGMPKDGVAPAKPANSSIASAAIAGAPRTVRLSLARIDPWSAMKMTFLLSVALGIAIVVAAFLLWSMVNGMGVLSSLNDFIRELTSVSDFNINDYVGLTRVLSLVTVLAVANVVLLTALGTLGAVLYNVSAALVGGVTTTLTDD